MPSNFVKWWLWTVYLVRPSYCIIVESTEKESKEKTDAAEDNDSDCKKTEDDSNKTNTASKTWTLLTPTEPLFSANDACQWQSLAWWSLLLSLTPWWRRIYDSLYECVNTCDSTQSWDHNILGRKWFCQCLHHPTHKTGFVPIVQYVLIYYVWEKYYVYDIKVEVL